MTLWASIPVSNIRILSRCRIATIRLILLSSHQTRRKKNYLWHGAWERQAGVLRQSEGQVEVLDCLAGPALHQVVQGTGDDDGTLAVGVGAEVAEVGVGYDGYLGVV